MFRGTGPVGEETRKDSLLSKVHSSSLARNVLLALQKDVHLTLYLLYSSWSSELNFRM